VIQEERSIFWELIVLVIVRNKVHKNICLILMVTETHLFEFRNMKTLRMVIKEDNLITVYLILS